VVALVWGNALELVTPEIAELDLEVLARVDAEASAASEGSSEPTLFPVTTRNARPFRTSLVIRVIMGFIMRLPMS
jgi:hypothetical protein